MTPWQRHVRRWRNCDRCELARQRTRTCLARGKVPCDVLFVGEAPGQSEDTLGRPFCGPAGILLQRIIDRSVGDASYCLTNLVACFPRDAKSIGVNEPPEESIQACSPRLQEVIDLCDPRMIVAVGQLADKWLRKQHEAKIWGRPYVTITHPAAILRADPVQRGLMVQRATVIVQDAVEDVFGSSVPDDEAREELERHLKEG